MYIRRKKLYGESLGIVVEHVHFSEQHPVEEIEASIDAANNDASVHGIIIQLPVPSSYNAFELISRIHPAKDVDCLTPYNTALLVNERPQFIPATTKGICSLLDAYHIDVAGKHVTIVGRSALVGKPTAHALLKRDATVTVCHKKTHELHIETSRADIVIVAAGHRNLITQHFVKSGQVIIDVGINAYTIDSVTRIVGDVAYDEVSAIVDYITPVPGGVGPMTIASLFQNVVEASSTPS